MIGTVSTKDRENREDRIPDDSGRSELFNQIITSHALKFAKRSVNRGGHLKLKGVLLLVLVGGGSFLLALELPVIGNFLDGFDCGLASRSGSIKSVAVINGIGESLDQSFNATMSQIVRAAGYDFDYYGFGEAGVDFFAHLPQKGHSVILILAHGTGISEAVATSDPYTSDRWVGPQLSGSITRVRVNGTSQEYFGLTPKFVAKMCGDFQGALVLLMGCSAMANNDVAAAFVKKGAHALVGWNNGVTLSRMDVASQMLLRLLLGGGRLGEAVQTVMDALGQDPAFGSQLLYYPETATSYHVGLQN